MAKWYGPLAANAAVKECLLLHGHCGYASETGLEQRLRDVMAVEIADGTARIQKMIIAGERYGKEFPPTAAASRRQCWPPGEVECVLSRLGEPLRRPAESCPLMVLSKGVDAITDSKRAPRTRNASTAQIAESALLARVSLPQMIAN